MNKLHEFIQAEQNRQLVQKELNPLQDKLNGIVAKIREINENLSFSDKDFISTKLWENMPSDQREAVEAERDRIEKMAQANYSYATCFNSPFDPFHDEWYLVSFEIKDSKIRFQVSCKKNEGSISGLLTFLDTHWTTWFDVKELD